MIPEALSVILIYSCLFKAILWGMTENRLFNCNNNQAIFKGNFRISLYHLWLFVFFSCTNVPIAYVISDIWYVQCIWFSFFAIWDILILDVTWWIIRYIHFTILPYGEAVKLYFGETNKWHLKTDFDSAGLPLWLGTYSWWFILGFILVILQIVLGII